LRILWVATKAPWPPRDGGRLALASTLRALAADGFEVDLVAPSDAADAERAAIAEQLGPWCRPTLVAARPRSAVAAWLAAWGSGRPWTVERHRSRAVGQAVAERLRAASPRAMVAEQLQAVAQLPAAGSFERWGTARPLTILRAQNVESELWQGQARSARGPFGALLASGLRAEERRLRRAERGAVAELDGVAAISARDAEAYRALSTHHATRIEHIPVPVDATQPAAVRDLAGAPALSIVGSGGWRPNFEATRAWLAGVWPRVRHDLPDARLHVFTDGGRELRRGLPEDAARAVEFHPAPRDSRDAFAPRSTLLVPLAVGSGIRMKILEAWARGVAVVASPVAAAGLDRDFPAALAIADSAASWSESIAQLRSPETYDRRVAAGREILRRAHDPARVAAAWRGLFERPAR
jgi:hypothetical protein